MKHRRSKKQPVTIYLIHFAAPFKHARHYLGSAIDLAERIEQHRAGRGARLIEVVNEAGIGWDVARTWEGKRADERRLKNHKNAPTLCPRCNARADQRGTLRKEHRHASR